MLMEWFMEMGLLKSSSNQSVFLISAAWRYSFMAFWVLAMPNLPLVAS